MTVVYLLDDATRPKAPAIPGAGAEHRRVGGRLKLIHGMHLAALDETKALMERVEAGECGADRLAAQLDSTEMLSNYRAFGNLCGRECQILDFHHTAEDTEIFPLLYSNGSVGLKRVIDRFAQEHLIVHQLLENLAANVLDIRDRPGPATFAAAKETFSLLYKVVRSHFAYEETELEEALGFYQVPL